jgi:serine/threonine protein phosphatase PrpC
MSSNSELDTVEIPPPPLAQAAAPESISSRVDVDLGARSHAGKVRPNNEDHFLVARFDRSMRTLLTNLPPGAVPETSTETAYGMLVADGVGGAAAGEVASRMAVTALIDLVLRTPDWIMRPDEHLIQQVLARLDRRFHAINQTLTEEGRADPRLYGMGTTLTLACSLGAKLAIAHIGDSRVYLFRNGRLLRLTRDHTLAQALADAGAISPEEVATHRLRHVLTNVLGAGEAKVKAELHELELLDQDQVLLCTDGLSDMASEADVAAVLEESLTAAAACEALIDLALKGGGKDNVTVALGRYRLP